MERRLDWWSEVWITLTFHVYIVYRRSAVRCLCQYIWFMDSLLKSFYFCVELCKSSSSFFCILSKAELPEKLYKFHEKCKINLARLPFVTSYLAWILDAALIEISRETSSYDVLLFLNSVLRSLEEVLV